MASFSDVAEINNALQCLRDARQEIVDHYGLTEENEWVTPPPPAVGVALQRIRAAQEHLENLCEFGADRWTLTYEGAVS